MHYNKRMNTSYTSHKEVSCVKQITFKVGQTYDSYTAFVCALSQSLHTDGFSVRVRKTEYLQGCTTRQLTWDKDDGTSIAMRRFVCTHAGQANVSDARAPQRKRWSARSDCRWFIQIKRTEQSMSFVVQTCNTVHNGHIPDPCNTNELPYFTRLNSTELADAVRMRENGVSVASIVQELDRPDNTKQRKAVHNALASVYNTDTSVSEVIASWTVSQQTGSGVQFAVDHDEQNIVRRILFATEADRSAYRTLHHCVMFDSTFKTNNLFHLVTFLSCDPQQKLVPLAYGFITDERTDAYEWLLKQFLSIHGDAGGPAVAPAVTITDGDLAMRKAVQNVWPHTEHKSCWFHLRRNILEHVHRSTKDSVAAERTIAMIDSARNSITSEEFDASWKALATQVENVPSLAGYMEAIYNDRVRWTPCLWTSPVFAVTTTSICESYHAALKKNMDKPHPFQLLITRIEKLDKRFHDERQSALRQSERKKTLHKWPPVTNRWRDVLALHALELMATEEMAQLEWTVHDELETAADRIIVRVQPKRIDIMESAVPSGWTDTVVFDQLNRIDTPVSEPKYRCTCGYPQNMALPCRHVFVAANVTGIDICSSIHPYWHHPSSKKPSAGQMFLTCSNTTDACWESMTTPERNERLKKCFCMIRELAIVDAEYGKKVWQAMQTLHADRPIIAKRQNRKKIAGVDHQGQQDQQSASIEGDATRGAIIGILRDPPAMRSKGLAQKRQPGPIESTPARKPRMGSSYS